MYLSTEVTLVKFYDVSMDFFVSNYKILTNNKF